MFFWIGTVFHVPEALTHARKIHPSTNHLCIHMCTFYASTSSSTLVSINHLFVVYLQAWREGTFPRGEGVAGSRSILAALHRRSLEPSQV